MAKAAPAQKLEEAAVVDEDLGYLIETWQPKLDAPELRRLSPLLRRLLVDGQYGRAWRTVGFAGEPWVTASDLDALLGTVDRRNVHIAFAPPGWTASRVLTLGGEIQLTVVKDIAVNSVVIVAPGYPEGLGPIVYVVEPRNVNLIAADPRAEAQRAFQTALGRRVERGMGLSGYLRSTAALVLGNEVSRQDVVLYVANKLGGAHFDTNRKGGSLELLDKKLATYKPKGRPEAIFAYAELLSIAETVARSSDASRFREAYAKVRRTAERESRD